MSENIIVAGASPLIEVTQSVVSATIRTREVVNLPLLTRNMNGLLALIPGSKPVAIVHPLKRQWGTVAFGGSTGRNVVPVVDGGDNRDNILGGPLLVYTVEGVEEFQVASHQFSAADGRSSVGRGREHPVSSESQKGNPGLGAKYSRSKVIHNGGPSQRKVISEGGRAP